MVLTKFDRHFALQNSDFSRLIGFLQCKNRIKKVLTGICSAKNGSFSVFRSFGVPKSPPLDRLPTFGVAWIGSPISGQDWASPKPGRGSNWLTGLLLRDTAPRSDAPVSFLTPPKIARNRNTTHFPEENRVCYRVTSHFHRENSRVTVTHSIFTVKSA